MAALTVLHDSSVFSEYLYRAMAHVNPGVEDMELYEFRYALDNLYPEGGWASVTPEPMEAIEARVSTAEFYESIQIKPRVDERIVLDENIVRLTQMLFVGLVTGEYPVSWVRAHFYFDIRGFFFLHRTTYFTEQIVARLGGAPIRQFPRRQEAFERRQDLGYKEFREANAEVDAFFMDSVRRLIEAKGTPIVLAIAGPTAAGKTEIVARLRDFLHNEGRQTTAIEMDNFLTDREYREAKGIYTLGKQAIHLQLLCRSLEDITRGRRIVIPRYDFVFATSSHDLDGNLKPGCRPIEIDPADVIFIEGNFPFLIEEVAHLIGIKVVYLTDDPIRLKRKWKRDIDYRKKYDPSYFRNRFFREQFLMAEKCYRPQMALCDLVVDTTGAAVWATPDVVQVLGAAPL